ncbi:MAG: hypothetical protein ABR616_01075 [Dermatophilaceae bacterium]
MSLSTTIGAGLLIGGVAALAVYASAAPMDEETFTLPAVPTFAPVPTPTVTMMAQNCEAPAVLIEGACVLTTPGPTIQVTPPSWGDDHDDHDDGDDDDKDDDDRDDDRDDD